MKDDSVYLNNIVNCVDRIQENTAQGYEEFMASHSLQDAVLRNLQVLAESNSAPLRNGQGYAATKLRK
jgi:uncharacterized protein with HEPN domain